jgi:hypothetical protein
LLGFAEFKIMFLLQAILGFKVSGAALNWVKMVVYVAEKSKNILTTNYKRLFISTVFTG